MATVAGRRQCDRYDLVTLSALHQAEVENATCEEDEAQPDINDGALTLTRSTVSENAAGVLAARVLGSC